MRIMISQKMLVFGLVIGLVLSGCAGTPEVNPASDTNKTMAQKAEEAYGEIEGDSLVVNHAPNELNRAKEAVSDVRDLSESGANKALIEQQLMIAEQRVKIAKKAAELRAARDEAQSTSAELQVLLDKVRQIESKQMETGQLIIGAEERAKRLINFDVEQTNRGLVLKFKDISFDLEKASLKSNAEQPINELANFLGQYPELNIRIEGYTDNTGPEGFNKQLSQERANAVRNALISRGVAESRVQSTGYGEQYPIATNETEAGRQQNRRVEVVVSDKSGEVPERQ